MNGTDLQCEQVILHCVGRQLKALDTKHAAVGVLSNRQPKRRTCNAYSELPVWAKSAMWATFGRRCGALRFGFGACFGHILNHWLNTRV